MAKEQFKREVEKELTGREREPHEIIYFKIYKSQIPVIEQALESAALTLGTDKSCGYCLEMICADFLEGANLEGGAPGVLLQSITTFFKFLSRHEKQAFLEQVSERASLSRVGPRKSRVKLPLDAYEQLRQRILQRDGWRCQNCGSLRSLEVHHIQQRSQQGDAEENLITLCSSCHANEHFAAG